MESSIFTSAAFSICALIFQLIIIFLYANKKKYRNIENTIFITLLVINSIMIFLEIGYILNLAYFNEITFTTRFLSRLYLNYMITWLFIFMFYLAVLRTKRYEVEIKQQKRKKYAIVLGIALIISLIISNLLSLEFYDYSNHIYSFGGNAVYVAFAAAGVVIFLMIYGFIFNSQIKKFQRMPIIYAVFLIIATTLIQFLIPNTDYNIQTFQFSLMLLTLFFTIESQDTKLLEEHENSKADAERANQEQTQFLTSMSHEIRTPMNTIMGFSDAILREKELTKEMVNNDTKNINIAAVELLELINNILDLSRIESEKENVVEKEYDFTDLLVEVNNFVSTKFNKNEISFIPKIDETISKKYTGDYTKIIKIILNVLSNLSHYIKRGVIFFNVNQKLIEEKNFLEINILADGSSIEDEEYEKYYKNFDRINNDVNNIVLGINVAKMYAKMLGGTLDFEFDKNHNINYIIRIEQQIVDPTSIGNVNYIFNLNTDETKKIDLSDKCILVVDDNKLNINLLKRLLKDYNAKVECVISGNEAISIAKDKKFDLIFLDHMMPGMDGIETMHQLKENIKDLCPVIALTANSYTGIKEMYINEGFQDYLSKPINRNELNKLLNQIFIK